jgi:hypothetical protein
VDYLFENYDPNKKKKKKPLEALEANQPASPRRENKERDPFDFLDENQPTTSPESEDTFGIEYKGKKRKENPKSANLLPIEEYGKMFENWDQVGALGKAFDVAKAAGYTAVYAPGAVESRAVGKLIGKDKPYQDFFELMQDVVPVSEQFKKEHPVEEKLLRTGRFLAGLGLQAVGDPFTYATLGTAPLVKGWLNAVKEIAPKLTKETLPTVAEAIAKQVFETKTPEATAEAVKGITQMIEKGGPGVAFQPLPGTEHLPWVQKLLNPKTIKIAEQEFKEPIRAMVPGTLGLPSKLARPLWDIKYNPEAAKTAATVRAIAKEAENKAWWEEAAKRQEEEAQKVFTPEEAIPEKAPPPEAPSPEVQELMDAGFTKKEGESAIAKRDMAAAPKPPKREPALPPEVIAKREAALQKQAPPATEGNVPSVEALEKSLNKLRAESKGPWLPAKKSQYAQAIAQREAELAAAKGDLVGAADVASHVKDKISEDAVAKLETTKAAETPPIVARPPASEIRETATARKLKPLLTKTPATEAKKTTTTYKPEEPVAIPPEVQEDKSIVNVEDWLKKPYPLKMGNNSYRVVIKNAVDKAIFTYASKTASKEEKFFAEQILKNEGVKLKVIPEIRANMLEHVRAHILNKPYEERPIFESLPRTIPAAARNTLNKVAKKVGNSPNGKSVLNELAKDFSEKPVSEGNIMGAMAANDNPALTKIMQDSRDTRDAMRESLQTIKDSFKVTPTTLGKAWEKVEEGLMPWWRQFNKYAKQPAQLMKDMHHLDTTKNYHEAIGAGLNDFLRTGKFTSGSHDSTWQMNEFFKDEINAAKGTSKMSDEGAFNKWLTSEGINFKPIDTEAATAITKFREGHGDLPAGYEGSNALVTKIFRKNLDNEFERGIISQEEYDQLVLEQDSYVHHLYDYKPKDLSDMTSDVFGTTINKGPSAVGNYPGFKMDKTFPTYEDADRQFKFIRDARPTFSAKSNYDIRESVAMRTFRSLRAVEEKRTQESLLNNLPMYFRENDGSQSQHFGGWEQAQKLGFNYLPENVFVEPEMKDFFLRESGNKANQFAEKPLEIISAFNNVIKQNNLWNLLYHAKNIAYHGSLEGIDPATAMWYAKNADPELKRAALENGALHSFGDFDIKVPFKTQLKSRNGKDISPFWKKAKDVIFAPAKAGQKILWNTIDVGYRLAEYDRALKSGMDPMAAADHVNYRMVDYSLKDQTKAAKKSGYALFTFWAWMNGNVKLHSKELLTEPGQYFPVLWAIDQANQANADGDHFWENPKGFTRYIATPYYSQGKQKYVNPMLSMKEVLEYPEAALTQDPVEVIKLLGRKIQPALKIGASMIGPGGPGDLKQLGKIALKELLWGYSTPLKSVGGAQGLRDFLGNIAQGDTSAAGEALSPENDLFWNLIGTYGKDLDPSKAKY